MEITLSPEYQTLAEEKVASGEYASLSELISVALRPLLGIPPVVIDEAIDEETGLPLAQLKRMIAESDAGFERGEYTEVSREGLKDFFESIKAEGRRRLQAEQAAAK